MQKTILGTTLSALILLAGCSSAPTDDDDDSRAADSQASAPVAATTPSPTPTEEVHELGDTVPHPNGGSYTAYDYRVVSDVADHKVGAIDVEICIGDGDGYSDDTPYVTTEFWTAVSDDNRRYGDASTKWGNEEISPILDYETDATWGDCVRGWIVTDAGDDSNITKIRYFNDQSEEPDNEPIIWEVPQG